MAVVLLPATSIKGQPVTKGSHLALPVCQVLPKHHLIIMSVGFGARQMKVWVQPHHVLVGELASLSKLTPVQS